MRDMRETHEMARTKPHPGTERSNRSIGNNSDGRPFGRQARMGSEPRS
jgi:hypothetical protein